MNRRLLYALASVCSVFGTASVATAGSFGLVSLDLVDHPVTLPTNVRSASVWRGRSGAWGENFAEQTLRLRGFQEIHEFKSGSNGGIDRVAVKRGADGSLKDVKFLEVKTSRGVAPKLGQTRYGGRQMSRKWLAKNLLNMRRSGNTSKKDLALEISRFRKASGRSIESLGEVMHVNPRTGSVTGYMADGKTVKYSESVERRLKNIQKRASSKTVRRWATGSLAAWDQIRSSRMSSWLGKTAAQQSRTPLLTTSGSLQNGLRRGLLNQSRRVAVTRILVRAAGPIAVVVGLAIDAKELADVELAYRSGQISLRQRNITHVSTVGGLSGALAGAWAGGATGAWVGAFGGPFAEITVPAGTLLGVTVGGVGGYIAGSAVAGYAATAWYDSIDSKVRDRLEREWLSLRAPIFREVELQ